MMTTASYTEDPVSLGVASALSRFERHGLLERSDDLELVQAAVTEQLEFDEMLDIHPRPDDPAAKQLHDDLAADLVATAFVAYGRTGERPPHHIWEPLKRFIRDILDGLAEPE